MVMAMLFNTLVAKNHDFIQESYPKTFEEREQMTHIPYVSAAGSLMYIMVYTWLDLVFVVGMLINMTNGLGLSQSRLDVT